MESPFIPAVPYSEQCKRKIFTFPLAYEFETPSDLPFNIRHIHPLKQRSVLFIYEQLSNYTDILKDVWVIGSSVRPTCNYNSDVDLILSTSVEPYVYTNRLTECYDSIRYLPNGVDFIRMEHLGVNDMIYYEIFTGLKII